MTWFSATYCFHGKGTCSNCQHYTQRTLRIRYFIEKVFFSLRRSAYSISFLELEVLLPYSQELATAPYLSHLNRVDYLYIPLDKNYLPICAYVSQSIFSFQVFRLKFWMHFLAFLKRATISSPTPSYKSRSLDQQLSFLLFTSSGP